MTEDETGAMCEMPRYKCHKEVWALKIAAIEFGEDRSGKIMPVDRSYAPVKTDPKWATQWKGSEDDLGYYVVYDDGYKSWSPSKTFEEGYTLIRSMGMRADPAEERPR